VSALCPGPVETEFMAVAKRPGERKPKAGPKVSYVSAEDCVSAGLSAIEHDRPLVIPGAVMKFGMALVRLTPMWILRWASHLSSKT